MAQHLTFLQAVIVFLLATNTLSLAFAIAALMSVCDEKRRERLADLARLPEWVKRELRS